MKPQRSQAKRETPEGFWRTPKGRAILAAREANREREAWRRFEAWD